MNKPRTKHPPSLSHFLTVTLKGFCMGAADVVPGVSGGTMAFILGIYEELILALRSFDVEFLRLVLSREPGRALEHVRWRLLVPLGIGILLAIFSLARLLSWLLSNHPVLIWSFFFGLILSSVWTVSQHLKRWTAPLAAWMLAGAVAIYLLIGMVPVKTPETPWFLLMSGAVAICAMILPGISGSFILVLLGKYHYVLEAVNHRDFITLGLVAVGVGVGLLSFARFLNWLLKRHHDVTIAVLTGLMLGSLRKVWPWKAPLKGMTDGHADLSTAALANTLPGQWSPEVGLALFLMGAGFLAVLALNLWAAKPGRD